MPQELLNPSETANQELGRELTLRYNRAINAWGAILHFGAMLAQLEVQLTASMPSTAQPQGGRYVKGSGLKGFLDTYAPEIDDRKARRIRDVAEAVAEREHLAIEVFTKPVEELAAADRKKVEKALTFLDEKNMKAVQLELGLVNRIGAAAKGGDLGGRRKAADMSPAEIAQAQEANRLANEKVWTEWLDMLEASGLRIPQWSCLPLHKLERMSSLLLDVRKLVDQAIATERRSSKGGRS